MTSKEQMLSCLEVVNLVTDYVEGELASADRLRFEQHVVICPPCRGFLSQMRTTSRALGGITDEPLTPELERSLIDAFRGWNPSGDLG